MENIRYLTFAVLVLFSSYTLYLCFKENFWKSLSIVMSRKWGQQVIMDLYVGLFLFGFIIYLNEGSLWITLAWLIPMAIIGNPITLLYVAINFESLIAHFQ